MAEPYYTVETLDPMRSIGFLIKRCGVLMSQIAERHFETQAISFTQWLVLIRLRFHAHMSATQLSEEMGHDMGALTRVVDSLERAGFVKRERSVHDRRAVEIGITPAGRREVEACMGFIVEMLNTLVEPYSRQEVELFIGLLQRLMQRLTDYNERDRQPATPAPSRAARKRRATSPRGKK